MKKSTALSRLKLITINRFRNLSKWMWSWTLFQVMNKNWSRASRGWWALSQPKLDGPSLIRRQSLKFKRTDKCHQEWYPRCPTGGIWQSCLSNRKNMYLSTNSMSQLSLFVRLLSWSLTTLRISGLKADLEVSALYKTLLGHKWVSRAKISTK